uniref:Uncharacterized protein n=1 Tax=Magallana gigas TaxID=29159 RepID=K1Q9G7_MAGGI
MVFRWGHFDLRTFAFRSRLKIDAKLIRFAAATLKVCGTNSYCDLSVAWSQKGSVTTFGITGALGVVWLFDVQLSDYLKYVPIFKKRFGDQH